MVDAGAGALIDELFVADHAELRISELPYGRQRLVELAIALGLKPEVLLGGGSFDFSKGFVAAVEFARPPASGEGRLAWFVGPRLG